MSDHAIVVTLDELRAAGLDIGQHPDNPSHWYAVTETGSIFGPADGPEAALLGMVRRLIHESEPQESPQQLDC